MNAQNLEKPIINSFTQAALPRVLEASKGRLDRITLQTDELHDMNALFRLFLDNEEKTGYEFLKVDQVEPQEVPRTS